MKKSKLILFLVTVCSVTTSCGKNNKQILIDHINNNDGIVMTSSNSAFLYEDNLFRVSCIASSDTVSSGFLCNFEYGETIGDGFFQLKINEQDVVAFDLTIITVNHRYDELNFDKIYVDKTGGDKELMSTIVQLMNSMIVRAIDGCSHYLEENKLPYIY